MSKKAWFYTLNIALPLVFGLVIYVLLGKDTYIIGLIEKLVGIAFQPHIILPSWIERLLRNYGADFLWSYSLAFSVTCVLGHSVKTSIRFFICSAFSVDMEFLQKLNLMRGTFDIVDIILGLIAIGIALQLIDRFIKNEEDENEKSI